MAYSYCNTTNTIIEAVLVALILFLASSTTTNFLVSASANNNNSTTVLKSRKELLKLRRIRAQLKKINKHHIKTIKSPDGDVIDCVLSHLQPAFDHPKLKGQKPLDPPERPKGFNQSNNRTADEFLFQQAWNSGGESCPLGTIPIRRTAQKDILRASSIRRFGRKPAFRTRRDSSSSGHQLIRKEK